MKKKILIAIVAFLGAITLVAPVQALTFNYNYEYSGATAPAGPSPWLTAIFADVSGGVQLTLSTGGLTGREFVTKWDFNLNPDLGDPYDAITDIVDVSGVPYNTAVSWGDNAFNSNPDKYYDIEFEFPQNNRDRLIGGQTAVFLITGTGLTSVDFNYPSDPGNSGVGGPYLSAAHVQGIGTFAQDSGWVAPVGVPISEPITVLLLGLGLVGVAGISMTLKK